MRIVTRAEWNAAPVRNGARPQRAPIRRGELYLHHTDALPATVDLARQGVRWVQGFHLGRGWFDVGYPFLYSPTAREVYLGRDPALVGAHTEGRNGTAHALAVLGDYHRPTSAGGDELPDHVADDLAGFLRWYDDEGYGSARFTGGHRDASPTACPGDRLYALVPTINAAAAARPPEPIDPTGALTMAKRKRLLVHLDERGGPAYEVVPDPDRPGRYALRLVPSRGIAHARTGDARWHRHTVVMPSADAPRVLPR